MTFYIDDFFLCCETKAECAAQQRQVEQVIRGLGLVVADEKTAEPTQQCEYLGLCWTPFPWKWPSQRCEEETQPARHDRRHAI